MKVTIPITRKVHPAAIKIVVPFDGEDDVASDFPGRGDPPEKYKQYGVVAALTLTLDIATRTVRDWPPGRKESLHVKPTDMGSYYLLDAAGDVIAKREEDYVPSCVPGKYGDYVIMSIAGNGRIQGWEPTGDEIREGFFPDDD